MINEFNQFFDENQDLIDLCLNNTLKEEYPCCSSSDTTDALSDIDNYWPSQFKVNWSSETLVDTILQPARFNVETPKTISAPISKNDSKKRYTVTLDEMGRKIYHCLWEDCQNTFTRPFNLNSHYETIHLNMKKFACHYPDCMVQFGRKHDLTRHLKSVHCNQKSFRCSTCNKLFARSDALKKHIRQSALNLISSCKNSSEPTLLVKPSQNDFRVNEWLK